MLIPALVATLGVTMATAADDSIRLTEPSQGSSVRPGIMMKAKVQIPAGMPVAKITYMMLEEDQALEDKVEPPLAIISETPPFEAEIPVPADAIGGYRLLAVAQVRERRGFYILFDEMSFRVEPEVQLTSLRVESPVRFTKTIGEVKILSVRGLFADGVVRDLTSGLTGTRYRSSDENIVRINSDGRAQAVGIGTAEITASNRRKDATIRAVVEVRNTDNQPPVADPGPDQTVKQGTRVRLDAIRSADPEGENPLYYWSQVKGMPIDLVEPLSLRPYFMAPTVAAPRVLRFRLIVKDKDEAESFPAYTNVTVIP